MDGNAGFPRYLVHVGEEENRISHFETLRAAASILASGVVPVQVDDLVLEHDFQVRNITQEEKGAMNRIVDEIIDSK